MKYNLKKVNPFLVFTLGVLWWALIHANEVFKNFITDLNPLSFSFYWHYLLFPALLLLIAYIATIFISLIINASYEKVKHLIRQGFSFYSVYLILPVLFLLQILFFTKDLYLISIFTLIIFILIPLILYQFNILKSRLFGVTTFIKNYSLALLCFSLILIAGYYDIQVSSLRMLIVEVLSLFWNGFIEVAVWIYIWIGGYVCIALSIWLINRYIKKSETDIEKMFLLMTGYSEFYSKSKFNPDNNKITLEETLKNIKINTPQFDEDIDVIVSYGTNLANLPKDRFLNESELKHSIDRIQLAINRLRNHPNINESQRKAIGFGEAYLTAIIRNQ